MKTSVFVIAAFGTCQAAVAHHGFGTFSMNEEVEITGTVTDLAFVNPHSWLYLDVASVDGQVIAYRCEMRSATTLRRSGWTPDLFPVGEKVTITGSPDRNDPQACYVSTLIFDDGSSLDRYGQLTPPAYIESEPRAPRLANGEPNISGDWGAEQLVMSDPRGVTGSLVLLSQAEQAAADAAAAREAADRQGANPNGDRRGGAPLITGEAASRLFIGRVELTEAGQQATLAARSEVNPAMRCEPISILMDWSYDAPVNRITQNEDTIVLEYGKFDYSRTIHLAAEFPRDFDADSLTGYSIARWEDDVLIVDTIGVRAGSLTRGLVHSDALRLSERFTLDMTTMALTREFVAEDPLFFAEAYTGSDVVYPSNVPYQPSPCDDRSLL